MIPNDLIALYLLAYRAENPTSKPPEITYDHGWFTFKTGNTIPSRTKYRRHAVERMRDTLLSRAAHRNRGAE